MFKINSKKILLLLFVLILLTSFVFAQQYFLNDCSECMCEVSQNYLATPYLANPNNLETIAELEIINIGVEN